MIEKHRSRPKRPTLFIGSSVEGLNAAYAIQENLEHEAEPTVWPQGIFDVSRTTLDSLMKALERSDFGIFVFTPDDRVRLRKRVYSAVRDNVLFELGLFTGKLGLKRTFIVIPDGSKDLRIPTDLTGATPGIYNARRRDRNLRAALGPFCNQVRAALKRCRPVKRRAVRITARLSRHNGLSVHSALYGVEHSWLDVRTPLLKELQRNGFARVGNHLAGDPQRGIAKVLRLDFTYHGRRNQVDVPEGNLLQFPV